MKIVKYPLRNQWDDLIIRPSQDKLQLEQLIHSIFNEVKVNGDSALLKFNALYDKVDICRLEVDSEEMDKSDTQISSQLKSAINIAYENIKKFHASQAEATKIIETTKGVVCWRESRPMDTVGIYVPGGNAPLFSTVLMLGIPAHLAGCKEIILCTPPGTGGKIHPAILYAARLSGVKRIFKVGGAQAIAAMTLGSQTIPKVNKIFGPGNQYVTAAKLKAQSYGTAIDMPAGPSELLIIADATANPAYVASDLLAQAEHGVDSQVMLLTDNVTILNLVKDELDIQLAQLNEQKNINASLSNSYFICLSNLDECLEFSNYYAPEHLILACRDASKMTASIENAGSVFIGNYSCESAGDYASGTNHTLPTNGYARSYSGVSLDSFVKKITFQELTPEGLRNLGPYIETMAEAEGLYAHKNSVTIRLKNRNNEIK